jgi:RNA polymerase sigma factor (sigma-70 family)
MDRLPRLPRTGRQRTLRLISLAREDGPQAAAAREELVLTNLGLVYAEALRLCRLSGADRDDLVQEGILGLLRAIQLFDPDRGSSFSTYACWWIRQRMLRYLQQLSPSPRTTALLSLDAPACEGGGPLGELIAADDPVPEELLEREGLRQQLRLLVSELPDRQRRALELRFGLDGGEGLPLREAAVRMGISAEGVRQLEERALRTLRQRLEVLA